MDSTIWAALIGAAASVAIFIAGAWASTLKDRAKDRATAAAEARTAVQELMRAALDVKASLAVWETRWRDKRSTASVLARSFAQLLAGYAEDRAYRGMAESLGSAIAWRSAVDAAEEAVVTGPMSRMAAAAARIAMLDDAQLREAATAVTNALGQLVSAYADRPGSDARTCAERDVDEAVGRLGEAARAYDGRPRR
ncbi:hypothetical protein ACH47Z_18175 [Streptomyces sp. NPDC020192]|uniref:hypothetical protein n=1 Tax=Streptomyces sp. NPDC020192 TaxID=3365066 RepID=UPI0037AABF32